MSEAWLGVPSRTPATSQSHISIHPTALETWFVLSLVRDHCCGLRQILRSHWNPLLQWKAACWKKTWSLWVFPVPGFDSELWDEEFLLPTEKSSLQVVSYLGSQAFCSVLGLFKDILVFLINKWRLESLAQLLKPEAAFLVLDELF